MRFPIQKDNPVEIYQFIFASNLKPNEQKFLELIFQPHYVIQKVQLLDL